MSFSQQLLSRDGPLAHVWLAANLEKKLTKNQLLSTNISKTTLAISDSNRSLQVEPLALRWTGTLLYGIVRIYSRKAKYLLDDVSDALFRLKTCFKSNSNSVILPAEATVIPSVKQVILNDTVTANDLLYQAPLSFDDDNTNEQVKNYGSENMNEDSLVVDASTGSIELGRGNEFMDDLDHHHNNSMNNNDLDLELDFDLGEDEENVSHRVSDISVEIGRDHARPLDDIEGAEHSVNLLPDLTFNDDFVAGPQDFDLGNDQPLTPTNEMSLPVQSLEQSQSQQQKSQRKSRTLKFLDSDVVRTLKRRLVTDDVIELTSAEIKKQLEQRCSLNIDPRNVQELILEDELDAGYVHLLEEYSLLKKRRIEHVGTAELEQEYEQNQRSQLNEQNLFENYGPDFEFDNDNMLESRQFEKQQEQEVEDEEQEIEEEEEEESNSYSQNILSLVTERDNTEEKTNFSYIFSNLNKDQEIKYPKKFATKCFFELLVLATSKKIELKQDGLFQEIEIKRVYV